jgi:ribosomal protein S3AE
MIDKKTIMKAFHGGTITRDRMTSLIEEANLRARIIDQVNTLDNNELAKLIEFMDTL